MAVNPSDRPPHCGAVLEINGYPVEVVDGTPSRGIGHLGPYAVHWDDEVRYQTLVLADPGAVHSYTAGDGAVFLARVSRKTGHGRWVRVRDDE